MNNLPSLPKEMQPIVYNGYSNNNKASNPNEKLDIKQIKEKLRKYTSDYLEHSFKRQHERELEQTLKNPIHFKRGLKANADKLPGNNEQTRHLLYVHRNPESEGGLKVPGTDEKTTVEKIVELKGPDGSYKVNLSDERDIQVVKDNRYNKEDLRTTSRLKQEYNEQLYDAKMDQNAQANLYHPEIVSREMRQVLRCTNEVPASLKTKEDLFKELGYEIQRYVIYPSHVNDPLAILSRENVTHIIEQLADIIDLYEKSYPDHNNNSYLDVFVLCRDLIRNAAYQMMFDKSAFTGSDHGVLHIHHNCENGHNMHKELNKHESSDKEPFLNKAALLSKIIHFYHDIGYSVGSAFHFKIMKDHPFIGGKFIQSHKQYFERLFSTKDAHGNAVPGTKEAEIIEKCILNHAIVSFDSDTDDLYKLVRFTTSNSDACAVAADQKAQKFWRHHPETIMELARMKLFLSIYPECASVLGNASIMKNPQEVMSKAKWLKDPGLSTKEEIDLWLSDPAKPLPAVFNESNFTDPTYYKAYRVFTQVKSKLLEIARHERLPLLEQDAYEKAILNNFNNIGSDIVIKQYGAELISTSIELNTQENISKGAPKYLPKITIGPSLLYAVIEDCFGMDTAGGNIRKVLMDEYGAKKEDINNAINSVGQHKDKIENVPSPVAKIYIQRQKEIAKLERARTTYANVLQNLERVKDETVSFKQREILNQFVDAVTPKENKSKDPAKPQDDKKRDLILINNKYFLANWMEAGQDAMGKLLQNPPTNLSNETFESIKKALIDIAVNFTPDKIGTIKESTFLKLRALYVTNSDLKFINA